jgi:sulfatase modifying factor 1
MRSFVRNTILCLVCALAPLAHAAPKRAPVRVQHLRFHQPARVRIEAGSFIAGTSDAQLKAALALCPVTAPCSEALFADETPTHTVHLRAFAIDRNEVSNAEYTRCVTAGACLPAALTLGDVNGGLPEQPVSQVNWHEAERYCRYVAGALPTEAQWERAARGNSSRLFPWGDAWKPELAQQGQPRVTRVDSFPEGRSLHGVLNMAGNVAELVADTYAPYTTSEVFEPHSSDSAGDSVLRGGSFRSQAHALRVTARSHIARTERRDDVGFRCAYAVPPAPLPPQGEPVPDLEAPSP